MEDFHRHNIRRFGTTAILASYQTAHTGSMSKIVIKAVLRGNPSRSVVFEVLVELDGASQFDALIMLTSWVSLTPESTTYTVAGLRGAVAYA